MLFNNIEILKFATVFESFALDPKAKIRNRGTCCLSADHPKVTDNKDHYPINSETQARNALARVNQHTSKPPWFSGSLQQLVNIVSRCVKRKYPGILVSEKAKKPGKD